MDINPLTVVVGFLETVAQLIAQGGLPSAGILAGVALLAGFVDAIAGGGGLLTMPALLFTSLPTPMVLGTNKGQSVFGSGASLWRFARSPLLNRGRALKQVVPALVGAAVGVQVVGLLNPAVLRPVVMVLLCCVALILLLPRRGAVNAPPRERPEWMVVGIALALGFYDGFFGPGTGTFLIMAYVSFWNDPMDAASANAKVVNFCSNLASLASFAAAGQVEWMVALPMAAGQMVGATLGTHVAISRGQNLVRRVVIGVSLSLVARLAWQLYHS